MLDTVSGLGRLLRLPRPGWRTRQFRPWAECSVLEVHPHPPPMNWPPSPHYWPGIKPPHLAPNNDSPRHGTVRIDGHPDSCYLFTQIISIIAFRSNHNILQALPIVLGESQGESSHSTLRYRPVRWGLCSHPQKQVGRRSMDAPIELKPRRGHVISADRWG